MTQRPLLGGHGSARPPAQRGFSTVADLVGVLPALVALAAEEGIAGGSLPESIALGSQQMRLVAPGLGEAQRTLDAEVSLERLRVDFCKAQGRFPVHGCSCTPPWGGNSSSVQCLRGFSSS